MTPKKAPQADLQNNRLLYFEIGLAVALLLVLVSFNWITKNYYPSSMPVTDVRLAGEEELTPSVMDEILPPLPIEPSLVVEPIDTGRQETPTNTRPFIE